MIKFKEIVLSNGNVTIVDDEDYDMLMQYKWRPDKDGYARTSYYIDKKRYDKRMHRVIMNAPKGVMVDHINGDVLDNRKENLRFCNNTQNQYNQKPKPNTSTQYKGVVKRKGNYELIVHKVYMGKFSNEIAAANAYNYYIAKEFGEFAWLNDVPFMRKEEWLKHKSPERKKTSQFKGVHWSNFYQKWESNLTINKKRFYAGRFDSEVDAAKAYNSKALELLGDKTILNEISI